MKSRPLPETGAAEPQTATSGVPYTQLLRNSSLRWWRLIVTLLLASLIFLIMLFIVVNLSKVLLGLAGYDTNVMPSELARKSGWGGLLMANFVLASAIPASMLATWAAHRVSFGWVSSIAGRIRWRWMLQTIAIAMLTYFAIMLGTAMFSKEGLVFSPGAGAGAMLIAVVFTVPFQAAGEEYFFRGMLTQNIAAWIPSPAVGAAITGLITSAAFAQAHSSLEGGGQNAALWLGRFLVGAAAAWLVWRTGGLEAAIGLHVGGNVVNYFFAIMSSGVEETMGRQEISWLALALSGSTVLIATFLIDRLAQRNGITRLAAQAAPTR